MKTNRIILILSVLLFISANVFARPMRQDLPPPVLCTQPDGTKIWIAGGGSCNAQMVNSIDWDPLVKDSDGYFVYAETVFECALMPEEVCIISHHNPSVPTKIRYEGKRALNSDLKKESQKIFIKPPTVNDIKKILPTVRDMMTALLQNKITTGDVCDISSLSLKDKNGKPITLLKRDTSVFLDDNFYITCKYFDMEISFAGEKLLSLWWQITRGMKSGCSFYYSEHLTPILHSAGFKSEKRYGNNRPSIWECLPD